VKPTIDLYVGKKVVAVIKGDLPWEWGLKLEGDVEIRNKDESEVIWPMPQQIIGYYFMHMSLSEQDTTLHFVGPGNENVTISYNPTKYAIYDPKYGSESYPQWPELLEEMGIPAIEGGEITGEPSSEWKVEEHRLVQERDQRRTKDAEEFLQDTEDDGA
jgi:hypothetical protein